MLKGLAPSSWSSLLVMVDTPRRLGVDSKSLSGSLRAETPVFDEDRADPLNLIRLVPA